MNLRSLATRAAKNPIISKVFHTAWQAAAGVLVAALTIGGKVDLPAVVTIAAAAAFAAGKNALVEALKDPAAP